MDLLLCSLWRGSDDPLRGMCPPAVPGQQPHPGSAGPGLPEPEAQTRAGLQPLRLRPRVGAWGLGTGEAEPSWSQRPQEPSRTSVFVPPPPVLPQLRRWRPDQAGALQAADGRRQQPGAARQLLPPPEPPHPAGLQPAGVPPRVGPGRLVPGQSSAPEPQFSARLSRLTVPPPQCSVTCGSGVQKLRSTCGRQGSEVDPENCFRIPQPPTVTRPCSLGACGSKTPPRRPGRR